MPKFKIVIPLLVDAEDETEARVTAIDAVSNVTDKEGVEFFLTGEVDGEVDIIDEVEELDEDNLDDEEEDDDVEEGSDSLDNYPDDEDDDTEDEEDDGDVDDGTDENV